MKFNPELNLGTIIEVLVFLAAVLGAMRKLGALEAKLDIMYDWFTATVLPRASHDRKERDV